jgi:biopolymer transport protein ExbD
VSRDAFTAVLASRTKGDRQTRIFLRADKSVGYGDLMEAMNLLRRAGYLKIALVGLESTSGGEAAVPATATSGSPAP